MISIIICSKKNTITTTLQENIQETVGIDYELIIIDNSKNSYSIFEAYNKGSSLAKFPFLCFVHEDVLFHTKNWGKLAINHLKVPNTGIIGMAGSQYLLNIPSSWFNAKPILETLSNRVIKMEKAKQLHFLNQK